ncbi:MAG: RNA polymerase sigma factor [Cellulosilyticaceae bacterium]
MTDYELLEGISQDDVHCYEQLITRYTPYVVAVISKTSGIQLSNEDLEELASDVLIKLWNNRKMLDITKGKEKAYIGVTTRHMTLNALKKKGINQTLPLDENTIDINLHTPDSLVIQAEEQQLIREAVYSLPYPDQDIFVRRYFYFHKIVDIAQSLNLNEHTVATKLRRGKAKLQKLLCEGGIH